MISAGRVVVVGLLVAIAGGVALWAVIFPTPRFPQPTGPYGVGTRVYSWTDPTRPEPFTTDPGDHRELVVQIWYPTTGQGAPQPYLDSSEPIRALAKHLHVPAFLFGNVERAPTHAVRDAPATEGRFPVLINPVGLFVFRDASLFWIEELAAHGYVVAGLDQPGTAAATALSCGRVIPVIDKPVFDRYMRMVLSHAANQSPTLNGVALPGGVVPFLADDLRFVLSQAEILDHNDPILAGHIDTGRTGAFGMSLGGYVALEACYRDQRFQACLAVDAGKTVAVARDGLVQPLMIIGRDADVMRAERSKVGRWPEPEIAHTVNSQRELQRRSSTKSAHSRSSSSASARTCSSMCARPRRRGYRKRGVGAVLHTNKSASAPARLDSRISYLLDFRTAKHRMAKLTDSSQKSPEEYEAYDFALPKRRYPVEDKVHASGAKARPAQGYTPTN